MDAEQVAQVLRARGFRLIAATPSGETELARADLSGNVAILVGSEEEGLPRAILEGADARVRIPMRGAADSLNVSVTAGILLYEASRQRAAR
jgi:TrmH family RNA methyltransferase